MDGEETPADEEVATLIRKRRVDSNAYSPKKSNHANKVLAVSPSPRKNRMSTNPYKVTTPAPKRHTKSLTLDDKEEDRSQQTI